MQLSGFFHRIARFPDNAFPSSAMKLLLSFVSRPNRRTVLRDLHAFGIVRVFRRPSIFRLWEPLRENPRNVEEFVG
jgi:hypothetical protein